MAAPISVTLPHQLGRVEEHRRIESGFAKLVNLLPGKTGACSESWDGDQLTFSVAALGPTIGGVITVLDTVVTMQIELPGVLGVLANKLNERLHKAAQLLLTRKWLPALSDDVVRRRAVPAPPPAAACRTHRKHT